MDTAMDTADMVIAMVIVTVEGDTMAILTRRIMTTLS